MRALIVANGIVDRNYIDSLIDKYDFIVACDGGMNYLKKCDLFVGDMDSCTGPIIAKEKVVLSPIKNESDLEVAIDLTIEKGYSQIDIAGAFGKRYDQFLNNLTLIYNKKAYIELISEENIIRRLEDVDLIIRKQGYYFSILALDDLTINIQDAKYEGNNIDIRFGSSRGLSNEFINTDVRITKTKGKRAYLIYSK